jgi:hypothetical protein
MADPESQMVNAFPVILQKQKRKEFQENYKITHRGGVQIYFFSFRGKLQSDIMLR